VYIRILPLLISGFITITFADSAVQTDWSGGPGVLGPVLDWGNEFYMYTGMSYSNPSALVLQKTMLLIPLEHTVAGNFGGAWSIFSADVNGDGYIDVLGAAGYADDITWWENADGSGISWTEHIVDDDFDGAQSVFSADVNGDGYMDVLGAATAAGDITWWENVGGSGTSWTEHTVDGYFGGAWSIFSADVNGDGYMDVLGAAYFADDITWWENVDGSGTSWTEHTVDGDFDGAQSVHSADVNGDGYMDILGAASIADDITWWENVDGSGTSWTEHTVDGAFDCAQSVYSTDVNGDGYMDVLGSARNADDITWWENVGGSGTSWTEHTVDGDFDGAHSVYSADVNGDGYMDVLGAAAYADDITWWENVGGSGVSWTEHTVDGNFNGARSVYSTDFNGDGYMDVLGAANLDDDITWWDLTNGYTPDGWLESSILYVQSDPDWQWVDWTCSTPAGTSVSFQVRASDDYMNMGVWSDTLSDPCSLEGILIDNDSYFQYRAIVQTSDPNATPIINDVTVSWNPVSIEDITEPIPPGITFLPITPNPVAGSPVIRFGLPEPNSVNISIFDLSGRLISEIHGNDYSPGYHDVLLGDMSPGVYFCRMISDDFKATQRFVVIE